MTNKIYAYATYEVFAHDYNWTTGGYKQTLRDFKVPSILIFGPSQDHLLKLLKKELPKDKKIIFEGRKALNSRHKGQLPLQRNTVIVVDKVEDTTMSEMP